MGISDRRWAKPVAQPVTQPVTQQRLRLTVRGVVQGVGFRPFVYGLANRLGLTGWVQNSSQGVTIEVEGTPALLSDFVDRLHQEKPIHARFQQFHSQTIAPVGKVMSDGMSEVGNGMGETIGEAHFTIRASTQNQSKTALILPDLATCPACLQEIFDPHDRRYGYPFTNCTHCGPRFSILHSLPYDRPNTTMQGFPMCPDCRLEYENPNDRRFHAQPNACPTCGPHLELWDGQGAIVAREQNALQETIVAIRDGKIVAVKGLGGFHLVVDAQNESAVQELRRRKQRPHKPFAVMIPSTQWMMERGTATPLELQLLQSPEAPIVLIPFPSCLTNGSEPGSFPSLESVRGGSIAPSVAPDNPYLGVMLPYTPLHHLLLQQLQHPIVATSGNLASEPICTDERDALHRLGTIADLFLVHDRPIARPVDDSIVRVMGEQLMLLRRARGYAPLPITVSVDSAGVEALQIPVLALGGHLKNTIALCLPVDQNTHPPAPSPKKGEGVPDQSPSPHLGEGFRVRVNSVLPLAQGELEGVILLSPHLGDLDTPQTVARFQDAVNYLLNLYELTPQTIACDLHPDYFSTQFAQHQLAQHSTTTIVPVQHHYAHILACMADNQLEPPVLGIAWDGTGYGTDGTIWGSEFLGISDQRDSTFTRVAHWRSFRLPGGDQAVKEPRRSLLGLLSEMWGENLLENLANYSQNLGILDSFSTSELRIFQTMFAKKLNVPLTTSMGRLFDGISSLLNLCQRSSFEGQAAMQLEFTIGDDLIDDFYPFTIQPCIVQPSQSSLSHKPIVLDWEPIVLGILEDLKTNQKLSIISAKFHNTLVEAMISIVSQVNVPQIALTGGCFQNRYLLKRSIKRLRQEGFNPFWHHHIPTNDGGIAVGQILGAWRKLRFSNEIR